jgi:DNA-binding transcriptional LysR family regulator
MSKLEDEVGVKLLEQLGKRVVLTEAGLSLVPYANRVIAAMDDTRHVVEELRGLKRGSIKIGASTTPGMYLIPKTIAEFKRRHSDIEVHLGIRDTRKVEAGVIKNEFDFGFVGGHLAGDEVEVLPWLTDELVLIVPAGHRLASKRTAKARDLLTEKFVVRESGSATRAIVLDHLNKLDIRLESVMEMENPEAVKKAVQNGLGLAFISMFAVEAELSAKSLALVRVKGLEIVRELKIVYRKDKHLSRAARAFIETAR